MAFIDLQSVSVDFPIYDARTRSLKSHMFGVGKGMLSRIGTDNKKHIVVRALRDITLSLREGDRVGLVGRNGAGKSTLLRVLSGIYEPPSGRLEIQGTIASMTNITMGMDMDASGYENIIIRGVFLGMTRAEAKAKIPEIAVYTELNDHLALPIRTYSNGMMLRLAFAISTCIDPEILIMDEMITTGDTHFVVKARERIAKLVDKSKILAIATHDPKLMRAFCNKAIYLEDGRVRNIGKVDAILAEYEKHSPDTKLTPTKHLAQTAG